MKTIKVILITILMAITSVGFAQSDVLPATKKQITVAKFFITLQDAIQIRPLFQAMNRQISPGILLPDAYAYYAHVICRGNLYCIKGSYDGWKRFFDTQPWSHRKDKK